MKDVMATWNMFGGLVALSDSYQTIVNGVVGLRKGFDDLKKVSSDMGEEFKEIVPLNGAKEARKLAVKALANDTLAVAGAIHSYATEVGDGELAAKVKYSETKLVKGGPDKLIPRAEMIVELANENLEFLTEQNITAAKITALEVKIAAVKKAAGKPHASSVDRKAANEELLRLRRKGNTILKGRLDKLMVQFRDTEPEFYAKYKASRRIVHSATRPNSHETPVTLAPTTGRTGNGNGATATELAGETR